jgi:hypothetical protein
LHRCRRGGGHRTASWHPTIDTSVQQYAIEQRILQMRKEDEQMKKEDERLRKLDPSAINARRVRDVISLGKQYAGRHVLVEESEPGVWIVRTATVIPDNERWLHEPATAAALQAAMAWSASHPPADADLDEILTRLGCDEA